VAGREGWNEQLLEQFAERCPGVASAERHPWMASAERHPWVASAERHLEASAAELMADFHQLWATAFLRIHKSVCRYLYLHYNRNFSAGLMGRRIWSKDGS
jgi:hypothetical protein